MFEHGDEAEGCPIEEIKKIGKALVKEYPDEFKDMPENTPALIGGFYKSHLLENDQIKDFVHRTIYEYFFTGYLVETVKEHLSDENSDWFVQKFCRAIQYRQLSNEMLADFFDHAGDKKDEIVGVIKKELEKALDNEQLSTESKYLQRSRYEAYVLANCLSIISKAYDSDGYWKVESENSAEYLRLTSHTNLGVPLFLSKINLEGAYLEWVHLEWANLKWANLEWANLKEAHLEEANLKWAHLEWANLEEAHLEWADLEGTHLEWAGLEWANLKGANLEGAHLEETHLEGANLEETHLEGANLEGANLEEAYYNEKTVFPKGFKIKGKGMKLIMPDDRIKDIDSDKIIQDISADEQDSEEEPQ